jgi:hypothetical protein
VSGSVVVLSQSTVNVSTSLAGLTRSFQDLSADYANFKTQTNQAIAGVAALAALGRNRLEPCEGSVDVSVGGANGAGAIGAGIAYNTGKTTVSAGVATSGGNAVWNVGLSFKFHLGARRQEAKKAEEVRIAQNCGPAETNDVPTAHEAENSTVNPRK